MDFTIFYAWQSDRTQKTHRYLIRDAAREAVKQIGMDATIEDSPRLDHDTKNVPGTPEIAGTIYKKIQNSGIFLADLTFVGSTDTVDGHLKLLPNPNVMLELGYAARSVGWERIICVMNTAHGPAEEQIFDLRHRRWPICYELHGEGNEAVRGAKSLLGEQIEFALRSSMNSEHEAVEEAARRLSAGTVMFMEWHAHHDVFWYDTSDQTVLQAAALGFIDQAVDRLLDLKLIDCIFDHDENRFVYRWTYIGKLVLKKLAFKSRTPPGAAKASDHAHLTEAKLSFQKMGFRGRLLCAFLPGKFPIC